MKKSLIYTFTISIVAALTLLQASCRKDLLDRVPTGDLASSQFWKTEEDALYALMGLYAATRPCFDRDYYFDGQGEYTRVRSNNASTSSSNLQLGWAYNGANYTPSGYGDGFNNMYRFLYGAINRANYVIDNVNIMVEKGGFNPKLELIIGEARMLRGLCYFRLISMWGDVPYFSRTINSDAEVANLARLPIGQVKDSIMTDLNYSVDKLPPTAELGRATKPAALSLRGKVQLYWASWNKNGWPELEGFVPNAAAATAAYTAAAADFRSVINDFGLDLYKGGEPGDIDALGKADILPNYYHLFTPKANVGNKEMIFVFTHGGPNSNQSEELMRDFGGRSMESSQSWCSPRFEVADRYQLTTTGEFAPKLVPMNPTTNLNARTANNSSVNPNSYANRDYRMKSTMVWDGEMMASMTGLTARGFVVYIFQRTSDTVINGVNYKPYVPDGTNTGYVYRKFVRNYAGQGRSEGDFAWPVIRLADVFLMYAEATNEVDGPLADAIALVNRVRRRGNLPALAPARTADKATFFAAIEQERIVELVAEGQRSFDIRRWRALERIWGNPGMNGIQTKSTWNANLSVYYRNTSDRTYQQNYIFRIPPDERDRNPNLTQNLPWR